MLVLSTAIGLSPEATCKRWSNGQKAKIDIPQSAAIKEYNTNMGGVDLIDRFMFYYRTKIRRKKLTIRI